jgi:hypothetical protein
MLIKYPNLLGSGGFVEWEVFKKQAFEQVPEQMRELIDISMINSIISAITWHVLEGVRDVVRENKASTLKRIFQETERFKIPTYPEPQGLSLYSRSVFSLLRGDPEEIKKEKYLEVSEEQAAQIKEVAATILEHIKTATLEGLITKSERIEIANKSFAKQHPSIHSQESKKVKFDDSNQAEENESSKETVGEKRALETQSPLKSILKKSHSDASNEETHSRK